MIEISSYEKLEQFISTLPLEAGGDLALDKIEFSIPESTIHYHDKGRSSCIDGTLIKILNRLQDQIFHDFGLIVYGKKNPKALTEEERDSLLLRVTIKDGSIWDSFNFSELVKALLKKMETKDIKKLIYFIVISYCLLSFSKTVVNNIFSLKIKALEKEAAKNTQAEYVKISSMFLDYLSLKESVEIDGSQISADRLSAAADAKKSLSSQLKNSDPVTFSTFESNFYVQDIKNVPLFSAVIKNAEDNAVYKVQLGYEQTAQINELVECLRDRDKTVRLTLSVALDENNKVVAATIDKINGKPFDDNMLL